MAPASGKIEVDILKQCPPIGGLYHALEAEAVTEGDVYAELGEIVAGRKPGRTSQEEDFIFDSTGTALQKVAAFVVVYERTLCDRVGMRRNLTGKSGI